MQVRFLWRDDEWREAYLLSRAEAVPGTGVSMNSLVVGVLVLGGMGDVVHTLWQGQPWSWKGTLLPLLLAGSAVVGLLLYTLQRRRVLRGLRPKPVTEQCLLLNEAGWSMCDGPDQALTLQPWPTLQGYRCGRDVLLLFRVDGGTVSAPLRAFADEDVTWLQRLLSRKIKAARTYVPAAMPDKAS